MSDPPNSSAIILFDHHPKPPHPLAPAFIPLGSTASTSSSSLVREYRKGNWTLHETLVLITAKKMDDERRIKASSTPPDPTTTNTTIKQLSRTAELRWKWVENYCWNHGCLRSQNQCNDKWDNLLRDYKKVREHESRSDGSNHNPSYWKMEKQDRKDRNLPSNLSSEVFQALNEVVHQRYPQRTAHPPPSPAPVVVHCSLPLPSPPPANRPPAPPVISETSDSSETDRSDKLHDDTERRKVRKLGSSIVRSASVLARTLLACEEKKEKRHRDVIELEERRLQIEETRNEVNRQGITGLVAAVNNLSGAIQSLISDRHDATFH
ncbi:hypothetical protein HHK36_014674 [Tetracentron sinense]|uniref:Myb-like domain-containing protein n=1 Tax=Tetracentron sinense TaxID=13715 RepID=A0A834YZE7_TETSI|nr:hypothetical protein HHK36_014674 [Tetracentron sinense]